MLKSLPVSRKFSSILKNCSLPLPKLSVSQSQTVQDHCLFCQHLCTIKIHKTKQSLNRKKKTS